MGPTSPVDRFSAIALQHNYILLVGQPLTDLPHAAWFIPLHPVPSQPLVLSQRILLASPTSRTSFGQIKSIVRLEKILSGHLCRLNPLPMDHSFLPHAKSTSPHHSLFFPAASFAVLCYDWFSSPVRNGTENGSEVREIWTTAHQEFSGCTHCCAGKPKRREQDQANPRRRGHARLGTAEG